MNSPFVMFGCGGFNLAFTAGLFSESGLTRQIVAVQRSRDERSEAFFRQNGKFHVHIIGKRGGKQIDETREIESISDLLVASEDWSKLIALFQSDSLKYLLTNSAERGWDISDTDRKAELERFSMPQCHLGKLLVLLRVRMEEKLPGLQIIPFELGEQNEVWLRAKLEELLTCWMIDSSDWRQCGQRLKEYLRWSCSFRGTLVDQMVPRCDEEHPLFKSKEDLLIRIAEPYRLLVVAGKPDDDRFLEHPDALWCGDQQPYTLRKLCILNGMHTLMAAYWQQYGLDSKMTVDQFLDNDAAMKWLNTALSQEILPAIEGLVPEAEEFTNEVLERFSNKALKFPISKIAGNHIAKLGDRLGPTARLFKQRHGTIPRTIEDVFGWAGIALSL